MRLIARYAKELPEGLEVVTVYDSEVQKELLSKSDPVLKTITDRHPAAIWFERKMADDFGIVIEGTFDARPLVHQEHFPEGVHPMRKDFTDQSVPATEYVPYVYEAIEGDGVFQVAVGPIHAGIIEPGHFQFSQAGEAMLHQEVRHFYKYRAIEKMLEGKCLEDAGPVIARISGNESIAYQTAWRDILLQATRSSLGEGSQAYHAFLLELERIIHHLTDLGFIPNDAGFAAALAFCSRLSEDARRMMKQLTGHRFGFDALDLESTFRDRTQISDWLASLEEEIHFFEDWITDIPSLWDRFDTTGILPEEKALKYDTVGIVARASGIAVDRRETAFYQTHGYVMQTESSGDVAARFKLRIAEVKNAIVMMQHFLETAEDEPLLLNPAEDGTYMAYCESSIGELFMTIDIQDGVIERFFVRDPSFMNWQALHLMMPGNIIADFPLINKSCDLSYAGNDL